MIETSLDKCLGGPFAKTKKVFPSSCRPLALVTRSLVSTRPGRQLAHPVGKSGPGGGGAKHRFKLRV